MYTNWIFLSHTHSQGTHIVKSNCQDSTDLEKAMKLLLSADNSTDSNRDVVIVGGIQGRFDQLMSIINALVKYADMERNVYFIDKQNILIPLNKVLY